MSETDVTPVLRVAPDGATPLPDGGWVLFRHPSTVKQRDRKALTRRMDELRQVGDGDFTFGLSTADATLALAIEDWSYDLPLPKDSPDSLDSLDIPAYDALAELAVPFKDALFPNTVTPKQDDPDRTSPTGPSSA